MPFSPFFGGEFPCQNRENRKKQVALFEPLHWRTWSTRKPTVRTAGFLVLSRPGARPKHRRERSSSAPPPRSWEFCVWWLDSFEGTPQREISYSKEDPLFKGRSAILGHGDTFTYNLLKILVSNLDPHVWFPFAFLF